MRSKAFLVCENSRSVGRMQYLTVIKHSCLGVQDQPKTRGLKHDTAKRDVYLSKFKMLFLEKDLRKSCLEEDKGDSVTLSSP